MIYEAPIVCMHAHLSLTNILTQHSCLSIPTASGLNDFYIHFDLIMSDNGKGVS